MLTLSKIFTRSALFLVLLATYYAQNYAGIIYPALVEICFAKYCLDMHYSNLEDPVPEKTKRFHVVHARSLVIVHVSADDVIRSGNAFFNFC